jgi:hypothetical protein
MIQLVSYQWILVQPLMVFMVKISEYYFPRKKFFCLDESENTPSSSASAGKKKGRGRPPKSAGSTKVSNTSDSTKRARGRPPKAAETPSAPKPVSVPVKTKEVAATNGKRRGRPSKTSTSNEQTNGISKPQVNDQYKNRLIIILFFS